MASCASAYSIANRAGCARSVRSRRVPSNTSSFRSMPSSSANPAVHRSKCLAEHRLGVVESTGHADVLRALTREQKRHPLGARRDALRALADRDVVVFRGGHTVAASPGSCTTAAIRTRGAGRRACTPYRVMQSRLRDSSSANAARASCSDSAVRADNNSTCGRRGRDRGRCGRLLENDVRVGSAGPERVDPGPAGASDSHAA